MGQTKVNEAERKGLEAAREWVVKPWKKIWKLIIFVEELWQEGEAAPAAVGSRNGQTLVSMVRIADARQ